MVAGENGELRYYIVAGDSQGQFSIDEESGVVTVAKSLDREAQSRYDLTIQAVDQAVDAACRLSSSVVVSHSHRLHAAFDSVRYVNCMQTNKCSVVMSF